MMRQVYAHDWGSFRNNMHIWLTAFGRTAALQIACVAEPHKRFAPGIASQTR
jgi:hypothetical protein